MAINVNQRGGEIGPDLMTDEVLDSADVLRKGGSFGNEVGLQQHFTPEKVAKFVAAHLGAEFNTFDPTAGDGSFLAGVAPKRRYGVEIDKRQVGQGDYEAVQGDVQRIIPLLKTLKVKFPRVVCNPPYGLNWSDVTLNEGREVSSTLLGWQYANTMLSLRGAGALLCGRGRFDSEILPAAGGRFYAAFDVEGLWEDVTIPLTLAFWVKEAKRNWSNRDGDFPPPMIRRSLGLGELDAENLLLLDELSKKMVEYNYAAQHPSQPYGDEIRAHFKATQTEYERRLGRRIGQRKSNYDLSLVAGKLHFAPTPFSRVMLERAYEFGLVEAVARKNVEYFVFNRKTWERIIAVESEVEGFCICPRLKQRVETVIEESLDTKVPMYPLKPQMRLGFLVDHDQILCTKSDEEKGFEAGNKYPITCSDAELTEFEHNRPVETADGTELKSFKIRRKFLKVTINAGGWRSYDFSESKEDIEYLLGHFDVPDPGTVEDRFPEQVAEARVILDELQSTPGICPYTDELRGWVKDEPHAWGYKKFQLEDLARLSVKRRGVLAWKQGLGKTLAGLSWIELMTRLGQDRKALIVCPQDLIPQWLEEAKLFFGYEPEVIASLQQAREVARHLRNGGEGVYITHYEMLSRAGSCDEPVSPEWYGESHVRPGADGELEEFIVPMMGYSYEPAHKQPAWNDEGQYYEVEVPAERHFRTAATHCPGCGADYDASWRPPILTKAGIVKPGICDPQRIARTEYGYDEDQRVKWSRDVPGCGYVLVGNPKGKPQTTTRKGRSGPVVQYAAHHRIKNAASELSTAFRGGILVIDELTKIKGDSGISKAIRGIQCDCVLGMTGTPVKNYIADAFWGLAKCVGFNTPRFPYAYTDSGQWSQEFSVYEWEIKDNGKMGTGKAKPGVTNLMKLWALLSGCLVRRTKEETGEPIVPRTFYPTVVPLGVQQQRQSAKWLKDFPTFWENENPDHPTVTGGTHHFLAPLLGLHWKMEYASTLPEADPDKDYWEIPVSNWTPKNAKTLEIALQHVRRGDRVLIGSDLKQTAEFLAEELRQRTVEGRPVTAKTLLVEGKDGPPTTKTPKKRAADIGDFKRGEADVLCAGIEAMAYGHSLDVASVVILQGLPWDYASLDQFLDRVHRMTSKKPVSVYVVLAKGTIDEKKWQLLCEKGDAAHLALDGRLVEQQQAEISKEEVLREMMDKGIPLSGDEVPEAEVKAAWLRIESCEQLGEFVQPEPQKVMEAEEAPTETTANPAEEVGESYVISELDGLASSSTYQEDGDGGLRAGADPEERVEAAAESGVEPGGEAVAEEAPEVESPAAVDPLEAEREDDAVAEPYDLNEERFADADAAAMYDPRDADEFGNGLGEIDGSGDTAESITEPEPIQEVADGFFSFDF